MKPLHQLTKSIVFPALVLLSTAFESSAQHFAMPDDPDLRPGMSLGQPVSTIPRSTTSFGSVTSDGWLYVLGGYSGRPHDYHREGQSADFYRVNLYDLSHIERLPHNQNMQSSPLETWNGKVIRTGGLVAENAPGEPEHLVSLKSVALFDPSTGAWSALPDMPSGRSSHDTAVIGSKLHVFGGWDLDAENDSRSWHTDLLTLDLEHPEQGWETSESPFQRRALATVTTGDQIVVIGGMTDRGPTNSVDVYNPETGGWDKGPDFPSQAFGAAADSVNGRVVASAASGVVHSWAPGEEEWSSVGTLTFPRFFHQMAADQNGDVLVIGGISRGMRPAHIERLAVSTAQPQEATVNHWMVPTPSAAKNRQGFFVRDGWVYMFGGNNSTGQHDFESENFLDECYRLNLATMTWRPCGDYPMARQSIQTLMSDDGTTGFALGGFGHSGEIAHTHIEGGTYDFKTNSWEMTGPHLPVSRSQFGLTEHDGKYWVFGGLDYDPRRDEGDQFRHLTEVLCADSAPGSDDFVDTGIKLESPRRAFGGVKVGSKYYMLGGMKADFQLVDSCDAFDFENKTWSQIASPERTRLSPEAAVIGDKIYLAGGMSPDADGEGIEPNRSLEVYDTTNDTWTTVIEELPFSLRHIRMMPFRSQLMIFSSHESPENLAHVVLINPMNGSIQQLASANEN